MAEQKLEQVFLPDLASDKTKLNHFFDRLFNYYAELPTEQQKRIFWNSLFRWNRINRQGIFRHAYEIDHYEALGQLMANGVYEPLPLPSLDTTHLSYYEHLARLTSLGEEI